MENDECFVSVIAPLHTRQPPSIQQYLLLDYHGQGVVHILWYRVSVQTNLDYVKSICKFVGWTYLSHPFLNLAQVVPWEWIPSYREHVLLPLRCPQSGPRWFECGFDQSLVDVYQLYRDKGKQNRGLDWEVAALQVCKRLPLDGQVCSFLPLPVLKQ